jgi:SAM-dependent methyltransferase
MSARAPVMPDPLRRAEIRVPILAAGWEIFRRRLAGAHSEVQPLSRRGRKRLRRKPPRLHSGVAPHRARLSSTLGLTSLHLVFRQTCRICGSPALKPVIDLGEQFLQGSFVKPGKPLPPQRRLPTRLVRCDVTQHEGGCGLLQTAHSVPPSILYANYWYRSGTNATMRNHLKAIAQEAVSIVGGKALKVLDIGCNDGTLLLAYPEAFTRIGVDPSDIARGVPAPIKIVPSVFPSPLASQVFGDTKFDIITSIAMFYDLEDPVGFAKAIESVLAPKGIWIFELSYLPMMLETNSFDTICHEHLEYYSLAALEFILAKAKLRLFRHEFNDINGGSIRCYVTKPANADHDTAAASEALSRSRLAEFELALDTDKPYLAFQGRIEVVRDKLMGLLRSIRMKGERVHIYGASTKGNTLLQWCGIDRNLVECAADRNPEKHGAMTLGTNIPIISEAESRAAKPDYYLVLPWHFKTEFLEREKDTILAGTKMIFPLPEVSVIGPENLR